MATITESTSVWRFLLVKADRARSRRKSRALATSRVGVWVQFFTRLVLTLAGFGFLTWGMFTWHIIAGLITAGLSCFVLSWLAAPESQSDNGSPVRGVREYTDQHGYTTYR